MLGVDVAHGATVPVLIAVAAGIFAALRTGGRRWTLLVAVAIFFVAMVGPLDRVAEQRSMALHMVQHLLLLSAVPALLLAGASRWLGTQPWATELSHARACAFLLGGTLGLYVLHVPAVFNAGLANASLNDLQHFALVVAGLVMALPLLGPGSLGGFAAVLYLVAGEILIGLLGIVITWSPSVLYAGFDLGPRVGGLSPADDQAVAGAILLVVEEPLLLAELAVLFIRALDLSQE